MSKQIDKIIEDVMALPRSPRDWIEDYADEDNGCYQHTCDTCKELFYGHKRRPRNCKSCWIEWLFTEKEKWRLALEGLTPGGSEFVNDVDYCVDYLQRQRAVQHSNLSNAVKQRKKLEAALAAAGECVGHYAEKYPDENIAIVMP